MQTTPRLESQKARKSLKPKENRVKVNEDKTGLMISGDRKARRRLIVVNGGNMELTLAGKSIKTEERKKSLGLIVSQNMNWTYHVRKCKFKLRSLKKLGGVVTEDQRNKLQDAQAEKLTSLQANKLTS